MTNPVDDARALAGTVASVVAHTPFSYQDADAAVAALQLHDDSTSGMPWADRDVAAALPEFARAAAAAGTSLLSVAAAARRSTAEPK